MCISFQHPHAGPAAELLYRSQVDARHNHAACPMVPPIVYAKILDAGTTAGCLVLPGNRNAAGFAVVAEWLTVPIQKDRPESWPFRSYARQSRLDSRMRWRSSRAPADFPKAYFITSRRNVGPCKA